MAGCMEARQREHDAGKPRSGAGRDGIGLLLAIGAKAPLDGYGPKEGRAKRAGQGVVHARTRLGVRSYSFWPEAPYLGTNNCAARLGR